jgi:SHS family sialic acid transporter-like MFS transporter
MTTMQPLSRAKRYLLLGCALFAWLFAGVIMAVPPLAARPAVTSLGVTDDTLRGQWFSWYVCAFLLGAAAGGLAFGWLGDRFGRSKALGWSVLTYSLLAGLCYFCTTPEQLLVLWFLACMGVGGVWPNGVSLAAEALPGVSRPWISGLFGTAANLGLMLLSMLAFFEPITPDHWRWVMLVSAAPAPLGLFVLLYVPESPAWLTSKQSTASKHSLTNWLVPWANQLQEKVGDPGLSAWTQWTKSSGAAVGSLLGGWLASRCGRRMAYFAISLASLASSFYVFHSLLPGDPTFMRWVFIQGFCGTLYFGWLPLYLPELFPTRVRATGTGVAFNWGRVATAVGVLMGGVLFKAMQGDYARVGQITCLVYGLGMIVICFAPDTTRQQLET